ncbi:MAG TPA: ABC transporter permease [Acidimicrobiia bacterium]|jgi:ribose transport system permease protein|nr:ABC transporter permease [Acidimicrobiia bacterium]
MTGRRPEEEVREESGRPRLARLLRDAPPWTGVGLVLVGMFVGLALTEDLFLSYTNLNNVLRGMAIPLLMAVGSTILLTTGMIDLSIGSMLALGTMIVAGFLFLGLPGWVAVLGTMVVCGLLGGGLNGLLVAKAKLSFFVVTLGTLALFRSAAQIPTNGLSVQLPDNGEFVEWLGDGRVGSVSVPVTLSLGILVVSILVMRSTTFGRAVFAVGGNEQAARLAGIPVDRVRVGVFAINGVLVGLAAVVFTGRIRAGSPLVGAGIELEVIAAVLLGGTSFLGGAGSMVGTLIGVLFIAVLQNGLNLLGVQALWQGVVTGGVLILAVWVDRVRRPG